MRNVALDLGNRISFAEVSNGVCVKRTVVDSMDGLRPLLGPDTAAARVAIEACRQAWYVHDELRRWGHEVLLVDTTRVKQIGIGHHKRKNDRIDAEKLALAVERGGIPQAHVLSAPRRVLREQLSVRKALVKMRSNAAASVRELVRAHGTRLRSCSVQALPEVVAAVKSELEPAVEALVRPLVELITELNPRILAQDVALARLAKEEPLITRLSTAPGVGPIVATAFVSVIDDAGRFDNAGQVEAYIGMVPSEHTSGRRQLGSITKEGNTYLRAMLVEAANSILRSRTGDPLAIWGQRVSRRRSHHGVAAVAVARRLAGILWAMWRDGTVYDTARLGRESAAGLEKHAAQTLDAATRMRAAAQSPDFVQSMLKKAQMKTKPSVRANISAKA